VIPVVEVSCDQIGISCDQIGISFSVSTVEVDNPPAKMAEKKSKFGTFSGNDEDQSWSAFFYRLRNHLTACSLWQRFDHILQNAVRLSIDMYISGSDPSKWFVS